MPRPKISPADLPQTSENWFFLTHRLRVWITPQDAPPSRPIATVIMDARTGFVLAVELFEDVPTPKVAEKLLRKTMLNPLKEHKINPHRPRQVHFDDGATAKAMLPKLLEWGIEVKHRSAPPEMYAELFESMEDHLRGGSERLAQRLRQVRHRAEVADEALVQPTRHLLGTKRLLAQIGEKRGEISRPMARRVADPTSARAARTSRVTSSGVRR
jgi:hypothetical protein